MKPVVFYIVFAMVSACLSQTQPLAAPVSISAQEASLNLLHPVQPLYPALAKAAHIQGVVRLELLIDETGVVTPRVLSGHPMLVQAALDAVKQWKYKPFEREGKAIR